MELTIRADVSTHMRELKQWLAQTRDEPAEDMNGFFAARVDTYEAHMSVWDKAYGRVAELTPGDCGPLLDLGCGTGLELDRIFARWPELAVTGVAWVPDRGETVLVVKSGPEEAPCVVGGQVEESIRPGEVWISVAPGAGIRLTKEGTIQLQGRVEVEGSLWLQGQEVRG